MRRDRRATPSRLEGSTETNGGTMVKTMSESEQNQVGRERALLLAAQRGDEHAFARLVERHRSGLECFCYLMLGDQHDARRALSETVLTAWRERVLVEPDMKARMWLYRVAVRVCDQAAASAAMSLDSGRDRESARF